MSPPSPRSRVYRLGEGEDVAKGVRRMARGRADDALDRLDAARREDFAKGVHEARKDIKKLRALLRLVRDALGEGRFRRESHRFRDAGRTLAGARDAEVKLQTLAALEERSPEKLPDEAAEPLRGALEAERPGAASAADLEALERAAGMIREGRRGIASWRLEGANMELIEAGLRRSYRRGRKLLRAVRADPTDHNVHEWRKRVKDLWYGLRIIVLIGSDEVGGRAELAHDVSNLIGDHHDLAVLAEDIAARTDGLGGEKARAALIARIRKRQEELVEEAIGAGDLLYDKKPKKFLRHVGLRD
jgi:CHAD domain-containing protein